MGVMPGGRGGQDRHLLGVRDAVWSQGCDSREAGPGRSVVCAEPVIPVLWRCRLKDSELKATLGLLGAYHI